MYQVKKTKGKEAASKPQKAEAKPNESFTPPPAQEGNATASKSSTTGSNKERQVQRSSRKKHAVPAGKPAEGSSVKEQEQTK